MLASTCLALIALAPSIPASGEDATKFPALYPPASGELVVQITGGEGVPSLKDLVVQYAALTGQHLVLSNETNQLLEAGNTGLQESVRVPQERVQPFFERILIANDFVLNALGGTPALLEIQSLRTQARNTVRGSAHYVPIEAIAEAADHPATLVTTTLALPNTDVRQLSNSMRTMVTDANTLQMLPAGNTDTLVLTGFGNNIAELADMLARIDAASALEPVSVEVEVVRLRFAEAGELYHTLRSVLLPPSQAKPAGEAPQPRPVAGPKLAVDTRTNAVIVAAFPNEMPKIKRLIATLDVEK